MLRGAHRILTTINTRPPREHPHRSRPRLGSLPPQPHRGRTARPETGVRSAAAARHRLPPPPPGQAAQTPPRLRAGTPAGLPRRSLPARRGGRLLPSARERISDTVFCTVGIAGAVARPPPSSGAPCTCRPPERALRRCEARGEGGGSRRRLLQQPEAAAPATRGSASLRLRPSPLAPPLLTDSRGARAPHSPAPSGTYQFLPPPAPPCPEASRRYLPFPRARACRVTAPNRVAALRRCVSRLWSEQRASDAPPTP